MDILIKGMEEIPEDGAVLVVKHDNGKAYIKHACTYGYSMELVELPAIQPEIIRCKDCKYMIDTGDDLMCDNAKGWVVATASDFGCVLAERRTDG